MRVALFVHCYYPEHYFGTESYTRMVARNLRELGHDPVVVTATFAGEPPQGELVERYRIDDIPVLRIDRNPNRAANLGETYLQPSMMQIQRQVLEEIAPDVVHVTHLINHTASLLAVCQSLNIPTFATLTDFFGFCFNNKLEAADGELCTGPNPSRSNCIACLMKDSPPATRFRRWLQGPQARPMVSRALAMWPGLAGRHAGIVDLQQRPGRLLAAYGGYRAAIAPTGFLRDAYQTNGFGNLALSHFGVDIDRSGKPEGTAGRVRFGYIGQLASHKGVHLLVDALRQVGSDRLSLDIFGAEGQDPAYSADLRARSVDLPIRFKGTFALEGLADILAGLDVVVIPSTWYENSPLILLQALATQTPVIVSDVAGMTEFLRPGENGFAFQRGDTASLAATLRYFAEDPVLAPRMRLTTRYERTSRDMVVDILALYAQHGIAVNQP